MTGEQAAALTGLAPIAHSSGSLREKRDIAGGRRSRRRVMFEAALVASHNNPILKTFAHRLRTAGNGPADDSMMGARRRGRGLRRARYKVVLIVHFLCSFSRKIALRTVSENRAPTQTAGKPRKAIVSAVARKLVTTTYAL